MFWGVLKNFLNKEGKNKINYTRYIFLKERGNEETNKNDIYQIIATCSHLNKISIISSIIGHHKINLSILVIQLFIILRKGKKKKKSKGNVEAEVVAKRQANNKRKKKTTSTNSAQLARVKERKKSVRKSRCQALIS